MGTWVIKSIGKGSKDWRLAMITALLFVACGSDDTPVTEVPDVVLPELPATPLFDAD